MAPHTQIGSSARSAAARFERTRGFGPCVSLPMGRLTATVGGVLGVKALGMIRSVESLTVCELHHTTEGAYRVECSFSLDLRPAAIGRPSFVHLRDCSAGLRREPLEVRKQTLASLLRGSPPGCSSISILRIAATSCSSTPARWGSKASCRSGWARATLRSHQRLAQVQEPGSALCSAVLLVGW